MLKQSGYAAIFLAGGVDVCYPPEQQSLYDKTMENGGVFLSQYPPGTHHTLRNFYKEML